jgi:hypothetical protein
VTIPAELPGISLINISILPNKKDLFDLAADPETQSQQHIFSTLAITDEYISEFIHFTAVCIMFCQIANLKC